MEKIKINKLDQRGTMLIVGIEGRVDHTMQTGWQAQEVDYFMKDVGVGGTVMCNLTTKPNGKGGMYFNIKDVDFSSAVKGEVREDGIPYPSCEMKPLVTDKDKSIVAQVILKGAVELAKPFQFTDNERLGEYVCMAVGELTGAYKLALSNVKAL